eukprot:GEMP01040067.1.p1 GENE.GEMP01040067.1~~GEMP01040067.1.p1  ORF type:complete len:425 (-),score=100.59 GEMP01040067.1:254-1528(-)
MQRDRLEVAERLLDSFRVHTYSIIRSWFKTWRSVVDERKKRRKGSDESYIDFVYGALLSCGQENLTVTTCFYRWKEVVVQSSNEKNLALNIAAQRTVGIQVSEKGTSDQLLNRMKSLLVEKSAKVETLTIANEELYRTTKEMAAEFAQAAEKVANMEKQLKLMVSTKKHEEEIQYLKKQINAFQESAKTQANKPPKFRSSFRQQAGAGLGRGGEGTDNTEDSSKAKRVSLAANVRPPEPEVIKEAEEEEAGEEMDRAARSIQRAFKRMATVDTFVRKPRTSVKVQPVWIPHFPPGQFAPVFARLASPAKALEMLKAGFSTSVSRHGMFRRRRKWYLFTKGLVTEEDDPFLFRCEKKEDKALAKPAKAYSLAALRDAMYNRDKSRVAFEDGTVLRKVPAPVFDALMVCVNRNITDLEEEPGSESS